MEHELRKKKHVVATAVICNSENGGYLLLWRFLGCARLSLWWRHDGYKIERWVVKETGRWKLDIWICGRERENFGLDCEVFFIYQSVFYAPTDTLVRCLKNNITIYIKTAPTYFGVVTPASGRTLICPYSLMMV